MKSLTEGAHQTNDDLIIVNAAYSWHASFWRTTVCHVKDANNLLGVG